MHAALAVARASGSETREGEERRGLKLEEESMVDKAPVSGGGCNATTSFPF
jgi:hypothetical protein